MRIMEKIIGKEVIDNSALILGRVKDIEVNIETNEIEALILGKGGIAESLGLSDSEVIISYDIIKEIGDKILINR
ncbi:MAG: PRC-barrel domain-containing protein [Methanobacterium sp.]|jgi:sporulation protein YlmC with PRC-barrel domain